MPQIFSAHTAAPDRVKAESRRVGDDFTGLIAAIRFALATLDRIAGRTTVPGAPSAADGTSIGLTDATLHRIARRAAVPTSPAIACCRWLQRRSDRPPKRFLFLCASQSSPVLYVAA
jgi:hypothetical protein